ncbi:MAG: sn-glycerol-1-phosphate dehydrogenase [Clostridia bacterium]|nr:sn-glycerol-1-phosphate dehydrogenase [Clostridia bacterium]
MNINTILKGMKCSHCGKEHKCDIECVIVEHGAIAHLTELCKEYNSILIVADENTIGATHDKVDMALEAKIAHRVIFSGDSVLVPNEDAINKVTKHLDKIDLIVGVGSGVIQDLCKYVSHFEKIPYMIVATAPSMDGYASTGSAMILKGMKETVPAGLPKAIIADTEVLKDAPMEMIKAGYGDIIGKYSALNDWWLSVAVNDEYFCEYISDTTYEMIEKTINVAQGIIARDEDAIATLTEALIVVGIMMSFATNSRPASGSEHHLSHFFEITGIVNGEKYLPHGIDVAYSTIITARLRERLVKAPFPNEQFRLAREEYVAKMEKIYGAEVGRGCVALQDKVGNYQKNRIALYHKKRKQIIEILSRMPTPEKIQEILSYVGLDISELYRTYTKKKISDAIAYGKDLKDRYTVLWLNYDLFGEENEAYI